MGIYEDYGVLTVEFTSRSNLCHCRKPGSIVRPFRPSTRRLGSMHPRPRMWDSNSGPSISRTNALPLDY